VFVCVCVCSGNKWVGCRLPVSSARTSSACCVQTAQGVDRLFRFSSFWFGRVDSPSKHIGSFDLSLWCDCWRPFWFVCVLPGWFFLLVIFCLVHRAERFMVRSALSPCAVLLRPHFLCVFVCVCKCARVCVLRLSLPCTQAVDECPLSQRSTCVFFCCQDPLHVMRSWFRGVSFDPALLAFAPRVFVSKRR